jgi:hypothetical protein
VNFRPSILDADPLNGLWSGAFAFTTTGLAIGYLSDYWQIGASFGLIGGALLLTAVKVSKKRSKGEQA